MIRPLNTEVKILVAIILFGIFYFTITDTFIFFFEKKNSSKVVKIISNIFFFISLSFITFQFCYHLENGYIPIYFLIFILIGFLLYYVFFKETYLKSLNLILKFHKKIKPLFTHLFYSVTLLKTIKHKFIILSYNIKAKFKKIFKKRKVKNQNT